MIKREVIIKALGSAEELMLGRQGEYNVRAFVFNTTDLMRVFGEGHLELVYLRPLEEVPVNVELENGNTWIIKQADTSVAGTGDYELRWHTEDGLAKSDIGHTKITESLMVNN